MRLAGVVAALAASLALAACGGSRSGASRPAAAADLASCPQQAGYVAAAGEQILLHYGRLSSYPADVGYFSFREALAQFRRQRCSPRTLGHVLERRLGRRRTRTLLTHLPDSMVRYLRGALRSGGPPAS